MTVVSSFSGAVTYETADPGGFCFQFHFHWDALPHRPPPPVSFPKLVSGKALAFDVYWSMPGLAGNSSESEPPGPKYHVCGYVPVIGHDEYERSNPGYGFPGV